MKTLIFLILGISCLTPACKKKPVEINPTETLMNSGSLMPSVAPGDWVGQNDQVDPVLGSLKDLD